MESSAAADGGPSPTRPAKLGEAIIELEGCPPPLGSRLRAEFALAPARHAKTPLFDHEVRQGWVVVSTLPNIHKHACVYQVADLEEALNKMSPRPRLVHVSSDEASYWEEVGKYHPNLEAEGYTLASTDEASKAAFKRAFGVGVRGKERIAHGLFALREGIFEDVEIPYDQMESPPVDDFVLRLLGRDPKNQRST